MQERGRGTVEVAPSSSGRCTVEAPSADQSIVSKEPNSNEYSSVSSSHVATMRVG